MAALGVPTTRSLAAVATGERVSTGALPGHSHPWRSHIRVDTSSTSWPPATAKRIRCWPIMCSPGTFRPGQWRQRAGWSQPDADNRYVALLRRSCRQAACLMAAARFVRGHEYRQYADLRKTIDWPCAFMESTSRRCAWAPRRALRLPEPAAIAQWNLTRFAGACCRCFMRTSSGASRWRRGHSRISCSCTNAYRRSCIASSACNPRCAATGCRRLAEPDAGAAADFATFRHLPILRRRQRRCWALPESLAPLVKQLRG